MSRIAVLHPHFAYPGGAGNVALHTADRLATRGHDVHIVSMFHEMHLEHAWPGLTFHQLGGPLTGSLAYWATLPWQHRRVHDAIREIGPDVLLAHVFPASYWAFTCARTANRPIVLWYCHEPSAFVHDPKVMNGIAWPMRAGVWAANPVLQIGDRVLVRRAEQILCNSRFTAERVKSVYGRLARVAYPGFDEPPVLPASGLRNSILTVGRLTRFKRVDILIRAARELKTRGFQLTWNIAGDGEERARLEHLAANLGVSDCIHFLGRIPDNELESCYQRALAVVLCSINEPLGLVAIDALARKRPVICSNSGGFRETVEHGVSGMLFRPGDWLDLADKIETLVLQPKLAVSMGEAGSEGVRRRYSWEMTTNQIEAAIHDYLAEQPGGVERKKNEKKYQAHATRQSNPQ